MSNDPKKAPVDTADPALAGVTVTDTRPAPTRPANLRSIHLENLAPGAEIVVSVFVGRPDLATETDPNPGERRVKTFPADTKLSALVAQLEAEVYLTW